jgi:hypothetical protein
MLKPRLSRGNAWLLRALEENEKCKKEGRDPKYKVALPMGVLSVAELRASLEWRAKLDMLGKLKASIHINSQGNNKWLDKTVASLKSDLSTPAWLYEDFRGTFMGLYRQMGMIQ